jgi:hypothetical protein
MIAADEMRLKHLEWIQNIITRQANNSFLLKGWSITLVAGLFALADKESERTFLWLAWLPVVAFGLLDIFYLHKENCFIALYDWVQKGKMDANQVQEYGPFCLNPRAVVALPHLKKSVRSPSIWGFYGPLLLASFLVPTWLISNTSTGNPGKPSVAGSLSTASQTPTVSRSGVVPRATGYRK